MQRIETNHNAVIYIIARFPDDSLNIKAIHQDLLTCFKYQVNLIKKISESPDSLLEEKKTIFSAWQILKSSEKKINKWYSEFVEKGDFPEDMWSYN